MVYAHGSQFLIFRMFRRQPSIQICSLLDGEQLISHVSNKHGTLLHFRVHFRFARLTHIGT